MCPPFAVPDLEPVPVLSTTAGDGGLRQQVSDKHGKKIHGKFLP